VREEAPEQPGDVDRDGYPYVEDGASLPARSVEQLQESLAAALASVGAADLPRRASFLERHAGPTATGRAAATLARRLIGLWQS
jgi:hypothetical protein